VEMFILPKSILSFIIFYHFCKGGCKGRGMKGDKNYHLVISFIA
jgi:hypothetical protein